MSDAWKDREEALENEYFHKKEQEDLWRKPVWDVVRSVVKLLNR